MTGRPTTIDQYLSRLDDDQRAALQRLRETIAAAAPQAEECISYGQPAFLQGRLLVSFGATRKHCALYLMSNTVPESFEEDLKDYDTGKGTLRFRPSKPLAQSLVRRMVKARLAENAAKSRTKR